LTIGWLAGSSKGVLSGVLGMDDGSHFQRNKNRLASRANASDEEGAAYPAQCRFAYHG